jgi:hypothetical protein
MHPLIFYNFHLIASEQTHFTLMYVKKGNTFLLQAWSGQEVYRKLRFPDFMTRVQDGGEVVSLTQRPPLPPGNVTGTSFC